MSENRPLDEGLTPAEERLLALLLLLQAEEARPPGSLAESVMRTLRWQRLLRDVLSAAAGLVAAAADGVRVLFGLGARAERRIA